MKQKKYDTRHVRKKEKVVTEYNATKLKLGQVVACTISKSKNKENGIKARDQACYGVPCNTRSEIYMIHKLSQINSCPP